MSFQAIPMNAARICDGLSKIGYTPSSAVCDIIDNSVRAKATHIWVKIERDELVSETRLNNVKEYLIIDDGEGMDHAAIMNALALGSIADYEPHSLSKFGLGLKSASFSQGEVLEVISSRGDSSFVKCVVSLPIIRQRNEYGAMEMELTDEDQQLIQTHLHDGHGTIVRIAEVRKINHPSIKSTVDDLRMKVGVIYYYMMHANDLRISINGVECSPFDVLFTEEANANGNLDENTWDGRTTRWIQRPRQITVDAERNVRAAIEVTQLPHPPTFKLDGPGEQNRTRDRYRIGAGNYGYYVYRNKRLLSWAESFGVIPQDQDYYAFRGRILIDDTADETFNIDVKKSDLHLSNEAQKALDDASDEYKRKSKKAWQHANLELKRLTEEDGVARANTIAQRVTMPEELPGFLNTEAEFEEAERREQEILDEQRERVRELVKESESQIGGADVSPEVAVVSDEPTEEQIQVAVAGETAGPQDKIFLVTNTEDNALWEPYYDATKGPCVRINRLHRFARVVYEDNPNNGALQTLTGLLMLQLAGAETFVRRTYTKEDSSRIESILHAFRRTSTELLATLCREAGDELPKE